MRRAPPSFRHPLVSLNLRGIHLAKNVQRVQPGSMVLSFSWTVSHLQDSVRLRCGLAPLHRDTCRKSHRRAWSSCHRTASGAARRTRQQVSPFPSRRDSWVPPNHRSFFASVISPRPFASSHTSLTRFLRNPTYTVALPLQSHAPLCKKKKNTSWEVSQSQLP